MPLAIMVTGRYCKVLNVLRLGYSRVCGHQTIPACRPKEGGTQSDHDSDSKTRRNLLCRAFRCYDYVLAGPWPRFDCHSGLRPGCDVGLALSAVRRKAPSKAHRLSFSFGGIGASPPESPTSRRRRLPDPVSAEDPIGEGCISGIGWAVCILYCKALLSKIALHSSSG
jgi:hypothetical protein